MAIDLWDKHACTRCGYVAHEVLADEAKYAVLECVYCGVVVRVDPLNRSREPQRTAKERKSEAAEFRFPSGRFVGKTLQEADAEEHGRQYLQFMRINSPDLRSVIEAYLFQET
jgi:uncharacterized Zn finger protein